MKLFEFSEEELDELSLQVREVAAGVVFSLGAAFLATHGSRILCWVLGWLALTFFVSSGLGIFKVVERRKKRIVREVMED